MTELVDIIAPAQQDGTTSIIGNWVVKQGDYVSIEDPILELETDKVALELPSPASGVLAKIIVNAGEDVEPGLLLGRIDVTDAAIAPKQETISRPEVTTSASPEVPSIDFLEQRFSPSVKRILAEAGSTGSGISGTGRNGRITKSDALLYVNASNEEATHKLKKAKKSNNESRAQSAKIPHSSMRRSIAKHMSDSVTAAPHVTAIFEADFSNIIVHRASNKESFAKAGMPLTYTAYFVAAAVEAMKAAPSVNSQWHDDAVEVFYDVNIGIGTALGDEGLVVPVMHHAQTMSLGDIAKRLHDITRRARENKLHPSDMKNGTFCISNHGVSGSLVATPIIINQPQSAILGIGKVEKRVCVVDINGTDAIHIRPKAFVSLTIDHRVIDGHQTNAWLTRFVDVIETWPNTSSL